MTKNRQTKPSTNQTTTKNRTRHDKPNHHKPNPQAQPPQAQPPQAQPPQAQPPQAQPPQAQPQAQPPQTSALQAQPTSPTTTSPTTTSPTTTNASTKKLQNFESIDSSGENFRPFMQLQWTNPDSEKDLALSLVENAKFLLAQVDNLPGSLSHSFRLELSCLHDIWTMRLRIDVIAYFHSVVDPKDKFFEGLQQYLNDHLGPNQDLPDDPTPKPVVVKEQCKFQPNCTNFNPDHNTQYEHSDRCEVQQLRADLINKPCGFYFTDQFKIAKLSNEDFVVQIRKEGTRDLVLLPTLQYSRNGPHDNRQLATNEQFWARLLQVGGDIKTLLGENYNPIERYHMNFGKWETAAQRDEGALFCHGHAHIIPTREAALDWSKKFQSSDPEGLHRFVGHVRTPQDEHQNDCYRLQSLASLKMMTSLKSDVTSLKSEMRGEMTSLRSQMNQMADTLAQIWASLQQTNPQQQ